MRPRPATRLRDPAVLFAAGGAVVASAGVIWLAALSQTGCWGEVPHAGCLPRVDFAGLWGAGRLADAGRAAEAYDWPRLKAGLESAFGVGGLAPLAFLYPPPVLLAAAGVGAVPYTIGFFAWLAAGLGAYAAAVLAVLRRPAALLVALAPTGAFFCAFVGQNGILTAAALGGALLLLDRRPVAAGVLLALFACKPQLALLAPVALVAGGRWRALVSAAAAYVALWTLAAAAFGPGVVTAFLRMTVDGSRTFAGGGWVPWWKVQSLYGALRAAGAPAGAAFMSQGVLALAAAAVVGIVWRGSARSDLKAAALAAAALIASPYAFMYDGPLLAISALFLLRDGERAGPLASPEAVLVGVGLFGQAAFVVVPTPLATPAAALALLAATGLRVRRDAARTAAGPAGEIASSPAVAP